MKFKLKRIDWYIIKQFLGTYIFAIALIIAISVVFDINEKIDKFLSPDVPLKAIVFDYYMNFIPYFANLFSPLFTFIAVIFFTSKLADNSEVIAMLASGMSFRRLMLPYAISAGIIALSTFVLNAYIIPPANATRIDFQNKYIKNKKVDYVRSAQLEIEPGVIAYFDRYDARSYSDKLFQKMSQVILDLGETESCIIEGRLSDYLLRNNPNHIAVLVTAPFEDRVEIVRKKRGLNKKKGAKLVKQQQKAREAFYKRYSAGKWKMTSGKDIVVNRAKLGREGCKDVIAAAYRYKVAQLED